MTFQVWLRELLADAIAQNKAHIVAVLGPHDLRQLHMEGAPPSIEAIFFIGNSVEKPFSAESITKRRGTESNHQRKIA
ncbi:MAG: hypothetical protein WBV55_16405 [Candidatus Sulfotelmatobacter sp.]